MNINKWLSILVAAAIFATPALAHCAAQATKQTKQAAVGAKPLKADYSFLNGKTGTTNASIFSEEKLTAAINRKLGSRITKFIYSDTMSGGLSMLKSDRADFMLTSDVSAAYIIQRNPELKSVIFTDNNGLAMLLRVSDMALRDQLNSAIKKLKASGELAGLYKKWISDLPVGQEPSMPRIGKTSYPETIYAGVSGDMPPLDYVAADGRPAGYNVALLTEISKIIGKNIEVMSIDAPARFAALQSNKIDVFFWQRVPDKAETEKFKNDAGVQAFSKKIAVTEPYCVVKTVFLLKK
ncbi:MAG: transporter substrate-binding domain-containing protein [Elusimicrobiota bacterium]